MAALTADDVRFTVEEVTIHKAKRRCRGFIGFGTGALSYPAGGVPLPAAADFGMRDRLDSLTVFDEHAPGVLWQYDRATHRLRGYSLTAAPKELNEGDYTAQSLYAEAVGW